MKQLHLMLLFDPVKIAEFVELSYERIDNLHAFSKLCTAFLVAAIFLTLCSVVLGLHVVDFVLQGAHVTLASAKFHNFIAHLLKQTVSVPRLSHLVDVLSCL